MTGRCPFASTSIRTTEEQIHNCWKHKECSRRAWDTLNQTSNTRRRACTVMSISSDAATAVMNSTWTPLHAYLQPSTENRRQTAEQRLNQTHAPLTVGLSVRRSGPPAVGLSHDSDQRCHTVAAMPQRLRAHASFLVTQTRRASPTEGNPTP